MLKLPKCHKEILSFLRRNHTGNMWFVHPNYDSSLICGCQKRGGDVETVKPFKHPICRWENWDLERLNILLNIIHTYNETFQLFLIYNHYSNQAISSVNIWENVKCFCHTLLILFKHLNVKTSCPIKSDFFKNRWLKVRENGCYSLLTYLEIVKQNKILKTFSVFERIGISLSLVV